MGDNEFGGNRFLFGGNQDDDNENLSNSDPDTDNSSDSSVFRTFMGGGSDGPRLFGSGDSPVPSPEPDVTPDSIPHLNYKPEDLEFDESYPLTLDKPIFKRLEPEIDEVPAPQPEAGKPDTAEPESVEPSIPEPEFAEPSIPEPEFAEPSIPEPEFAEPSIPEPDYSVPDAQPFYDEPSYPQPEAAEPSIPEPDYSVPDTAQPFYDEPSYPQPEAAEPSIPEPDYTEPEAEQSYYAESAYQQTEEPAYQQTEEPAAPAVDTYESSAYDDFSDTSSTPDANAYADNPVYTDGEPYPEEFDEAAVSGNTGNSAGTDSFADEDDEMSDTAFPLFLSFKANDSAASVSEAIREKNVQKGSDSASRGSAGKSAASKQPVDEKTYNEMLNKAEPAVFKPYQAADEPENAYDIPSVSSQNRGLDKAEQEPAPSRPVFKQQESRPAPPSRSAAAKPETDNAADSDTTVRPGTRYYPAAQQMGYAAPMPQRELNSKRKKKKHGPLIITLALATVLVAALFIWTRYDIGRKLADGSFNTTATTTEASSSNETSSLPAVVTTTSTPTPKATATPTTKATATPTPKATATPTPKATATPTPKATATPTPKATATPTPKATATPTPKATATPTPKATATPTPKATATPTPKATATPTPKATPTPTPKATPTPTPTSGESAKIPSGFSTSITDGSAKGDTATFNIQFKNLGKTDVSLFDGVEYITITFSASGSPVTSVTSDSFTFTTDPKHANTFIGIPTDKEVIARKDTKTVGITGVTDGKNVGKYTIKYFVKTY